VSTSGGAPYLRLAEQLRELVISGELAAGDHLPTRQQLCERYGVTPNVAQRAVRLLMSEGLVTGRQGGGTCVRVRAEGGLLARTPVSHPDELPYKATSTTETAPGTVATRLHLDGAALVMRTDYEYADDAGRRIRLMSSWEPLALVGSSAVVLPEAGSHKGIGVVARMALLAVTVTGVREHVSARLATPRERQKLGLTPNSTVLLVERTHYDDTGRPVETADLVTPAEGWRIGYDLPIPPEQKP
jgi:GntR family transcriptional regulator